MFDKFPRYFPSLLTKLAVSPPLESFGNKSNWKINFGPALHRFPNDLCTKRLTNFRGALLLAILHKVIVIVIYHCNNIYWAQNSQLICIGGVGNENSDLLSCQETIFTRKKKATLFFHILTSYIWLFWPTHLQSWEGPRSKLKVTLLIVKWEPRNVWQKEIRLSLVSIVYLWYC